MNEDLAIALAARDTRRGGGDHTRALPREMLGDGDHRFSARGGVPDDAALLDGLAPAELRTAASRAAA